VICVVFANTVHKVHYWMRVGYYYIEKRVVKEHYYLDIQASFLQAMDHLDNLVVDKLEKVDFVVGMEGN